MPKKQNLPPKTRSKRTTKINGEKVLRRLSQGKSLRQIGKEQKVAHTTIARFLERMQPYFQSVESLHRTRADLLAILHGKSLSIQERMLEELEKRIEKDGFLDALTTTQIMSILKGVGVNQAVLYDKLRLERGESTENVGLAGLVMHFHDKIGVIDPRTGELRKEIAVMKPKDSNYTST